MEVWRKWKIQGSDGCWESGRCRGEKVEEDMTERGCNENRNGMRSKGKAREIKDASGWRQSSGWRTVRKSEVKMCERGWRKIPWNRDDVEEEVCEKCGGRREEKY